MTLHPRTHQRRFSVLQQLRSGAATVEMAICLPVLVLITFGSIETANIVFLKQALSTAAYEAARVISNDGATKAKARQRAKEVLNARNIEDFSFEFSPNNINQNTPRGTVIKVTVSAPTSANSVGVQWFFTNDTLQSFTTMVRQ